MANETIGLVIIDLHDDSGRRLLTAANLTPRSFWRQVKNQKFAGIAGEQLT
jgi:hypothetical protein